MNDNTLLDLHNSSDDTKAEFNNRLLLNTSNNQRLRSAGDYDQRSKLLVKMLLLQRYALRKFHVTDGQTTRDQIMSERRSKMRAFYTFLLEVQTTAGYMHATHAQ